MATALKAIETVYKGYRFRSRLEARWAVFFDALGVPYEYEPQGFELDSGRYLPDFWLPREQVWVEVKGTAEMVTPVVQARARELARRSGHDVYIVQQDPATDAPHWMAWPGSPPWTEMPPGWEHYDWSGVRMATDGLLACVGCGRLVGGGHSDCGCHPGGRSARSWNWRLRQARILARQARFEHGATPTIQIPSYPIWQPTARPRVYLAGKVTPWRDVLHDYPRGLLSGYMDTGPHIIEEHGTFRHETVEDDLRAITDAACLFAWVDSGDCYGTIAELGFARAHRKPIFMAFPCGGFTGFHDQWFVQEFATEVVPAASAYDGWLLFHEWMLARNHRA